MKGPWGCCVLLCCCCCECGSVVGFSWLWFLLFDWGAGAQLLCLYPCRCPLVLLLKIQPKAVDYVLYVPAINPLPTAWPCSPAIAHTIRLSARTHF